MKSFTLALLCLLVAISSASQPTKPHVNLGMTIDEFVAKFDVSRTDTPEELNINTAAHDAMNGKRIIIHVNVDGKRTAYLFETRTLQEIEVTAGNTFEHELQVLTVQLGVSNVSKTDEAIWDRGDGTRFTLTSRQGTGVLLITPTPSEDK
jgi:alpha-L-arabinofuranosidase